MRNAQRFCWRERTERVNWRMLQRLDLSEIVRRGDPTLLEPFALHLTFARLPSGATSTSNGDIRQDAWFVVRILQLSMEYLLYMRSRDASVLESLGKELQLYEQERDEMNERAQKWKERSKSGEKQVEKLHRVLQSIAKLLQIQGATPSAVSTIETLLRDLTLVQRKHGKQAEQLEQRAQEARVCSLCGKMFASAAFLDKHILRRHSEEIMGSKYPVEQKQRTAGRQETTPEDNNDRNSKDELVKQEVSLNRMLKQIERTLHEHQESLRVMARQEANKIQQLYDELHTENQLAEELKASRIMVEKQLQQAKDQLHSVLEEKEEATSALNELKEQIQFLTLKRKMEGTTYVAAQVSSTPPDRDINANLELKRMEQTLSMVNAALLTSREELSTLQKSHVATLKEKKMLQDQLEEVNNRVVLLETRLSTANGALSVPAITNDFGCQTDAVDLLDRWTQVEDNRSESPARKTPYVGTSEDVETQIMKQDKPELVDAEMQTSSIEQNQSDVEESTSHNFLPQMAQTVAIDRARLSSESDVVPQDFKSPRDIPKESRQSVDVATSTLIPEDQSSDYLHHVLCQGLLDTVSANAQRCAEDALKSLSQHTNPNDSSGFCSLRRREFLRSRYLHDETLVKERIERCIQQLDLAAQRFGVPPKCTLLSNTHMQIVQQALHGHLEILSAEVLEKMVQCENKLNDMIAKEWVPREKMRQEALERFKTETAAKSQLNQGLVKQAMVAFSTASDAEEIDNHQKLPLGNIIAADVTVKEQARAQDISIIEGNRVMSTAAANESAVTLPPRQESPSMIMHITPCSLPFESEKMGQIANREVAPVTTIVTADDPTIGAELTTRIPWRETMASSENVSTAEMQLHQNGTSTVRIEVESPPAGHQTIKVVSVSPRPSSPKSLEIVANVNAGVEPATHDESVKGDDFRTFSSKAKPSLEAFRARLQKIDTNDETSVILTSGSLISENGDDDQCTSKISSMLLHEGLASKEGSESLGDTLDRPEDGVESVEQTSIEVLNDEENHNHLRQSAISSSGRSFSVIDPSETSFQESISSIESESVKMADDSHSMDLHKNGGDSIVRSIQFTASDDQAIVRSDSSSDEDEIDVQEIDDIDSIPTLMDTPESVEVVDTGITPPDQTSSIAYSQPQPYSNRLATKVMDFDDLDMEEMELT